MIILHYISIKEGNIPCIILQKGVILWLRQNSKDLCCDPVFEICNEPYGLSLSSPLGYYGILGHMDQGRVLFLLLFTTCSSFFCWASLKDDNGLCSLTACGLSSTVGYGILLPLNPERTTRYHASFWTMGSVKCSGLHFIQIGNPMCSGTQDLDIPYRQQLPGSS